MSEKKADILIVNDEDDIARIIIDRLEFLGYNTRRARDGHECLAMLEQHLPDLVLLDLRMPNMSGEEVIGHVMEKNIQVPVIVVSASADRDLIDVCMERGVMDYMIKPFDGATLVEKVRGALEGIA